MRRHRAISVTLLFLVVGGSNVAHAQNPHGKKAAADPQAGKAAPVQHAEKPAPAPHAQKVAPAPHVEKSAPVQHVQKSAPVQHVQKSATVQHVQRSVPVAHVQKSAPAARVQRVAPAPRVEKSVPVARAQIAAPVPHTEQQHRVRLQQQWAAQYKGHLAQQTRLAQQQIPRLQQQKRVAQYRFEQQYAARLAAQQQQLQAARDYSNDPYVIAPYTYGYVANGYQRQTNQYGADVLRQAVNYGYQEGYQSGQADRQDGWAANYRNSYAYSDANYGYAGNYVDQSDYNYYFRQGFRRGYEDGYYSRSQYGNFSGGSTSILGSVLSAILGLTSLR
jgi:hypothetical protein